MGTEAEAEHLVVMTCPLDYEGHYYARELAREQTLDNLAAFGERLHQAHALLEGIGSCECLP